MSLTTRQKQVITHDNTPTSKKNLVIEKQLMRSLNDIVNTIKKQIVPSSAWTEIEGKFRYQYNTLVYDTIREAATQSYLLGAEFVASNLSTKIPVFLTETDVLRIKAIAEDHTNQFWGRMRITTSRQADLLYRNMNPNQRPPDSFLNPNFVVTSIAIGVTNIALNVATITKRRDLIQKYRVSPFTVQQIQKRKLMQFQTEAIDPDNFDELGVEDIILSVDPETILMLDTKMVWVTANDERVCDICMGLEGDYDIADPAIPVPVVDTHSYCRCRIIPA